MKHPKPKQIAFFAKHNKQLDVPDYVAAAVWLVVMPITGGIVGFYGYTVSALLLERYVLPWLAPPTYTYGIQFGLISTPVAIVICMGIGFGLAWLLIRGPAIAAIILIVNSLLSSMAVDSLWRNDVSTNGKCTSHVVLYWPLVAICALSVLVTLLVLVYWLTTHDQKTPATVREGAR